MGVVKPSDIADLEEALVESVIFAFMMKNPDACGKLHGLPDESHISKGSGTFTFYVPEPTALDYKYSVTYPDGDWKEIEPMSPDDDGVEAGQPTKGSTGAYLFDGPSLWAQIRSTVEAWIDPWTMAPDPDVFTDQIISMTNIMEQLYVQDAPINKPSDGTSGARTVSAVTDVKTALGNMDLVPANNPSLSIQSLRNTYTDDVERTIDGQYSMASIAGLAIAGECQAWANTLANLRDFIKNSTIDFNSYARSQRAKSAPVWLTAVSGLSTIGAGATFWVPPASVALTVVAGVTSIAAALFPTQEEHPATHIALSGGSYDAYWSSFTDGISKISAELRTAEHGISSGCRAQLSDVSTAPDNYSITLNTKNGHQGYGDNLSPFLHSTGIEINKNALKTLAGSIELISKHQRAIANLVDGHDGSGNPTAYAMEEWYRSWLPDGKVIGSDWYGPYTDYSNVAERLTTILLSDSKTANSVAERCMELELDFSTSDHNMRTQLNNITKQMDTDPIPTVNNR